MEKGTIGEKKGKALVKSPKCDIVAGAESAFESSVPHETAHLVRGALRLKESGHGLLLSTSFVLGGRSGRNFETFVDFLRSFLLLCLSNENTRGQCRDQVAGLGKGFAGIKRLLLRR